MPSRKYGFLTAMFQTWKVECGFPVAKVDYSQWSVMEKIPWHPSLFNTRPNWRGQVSLRLASNILNEIVQFIRLPIYCNLLQVYWPTLLNKLEKQQFDAGNAFSILQVVLGLLKIARILKTFAHRSNTRRGRRRMETLPLLWRLHSI